jgi:DNA repair exonuclease SbcCD ATPase subunit
LQSFHRKLERENEQLKRKIKEETKEKERERKQAEEKVEKSNQVFGALTLCYAQSVNNDLMSELRQKKEEMEELEGEMKKLREDRDLWVHRYTERNEKYDKELKNDLKKMKEIEEKKRDEITIRFDRKKKEEILKVRQDLAKKSTLEKQELEDKVTSLSTQITEMKRTESDLRTDKIRQQDKENELREKMTSLNKRLTEMERTESDLRTEKSRLMEDFENLKKMEKDRKRKRDEEKQAEKKREKEGEENREEEKKKRRIDRLEQAVTTIQKSFSSWITTIPIGKESFFVKKHLEWIKFLAESEETRAYLDTHEHQEYKVDLEKGTFKIKVQIEEIHMRCIAEKVPNVGNLFLHRVPKKLRYFYWIASLKVFLKKTRGESRWNHAIKKLGVSNIASTLINQGLWWETLIEETARIVEDIKKLETEDEKSFLDLVNKILQTQ